MEECYPILDGVIKSVMKLWMVDLCLHYFFQGQEILPPVFFQCLAYVFTAFSLS